MPPSGRSPQDFRRNGSMASENAILSPPFRGRAIAFGETVAFLSSVIPAEELVKKSPTHSAAVKMRKKRIGSGGLTNRCFGMDGKNDSFFPGRRTNYISSQPRKRESSSPKPVTRPRIPACAGMTGVSCCPRTLSCARVWGACGTINLSSDDALAALQISCRSRAQAREGFSRGWAEAHPDSTNLLNLTHTTIPAPVLWGRVRVAAC